MKTRRTPFLVIAALLVAGFQTAAQASTFTDRMEQTFATGPTVEVKLGNTNGSVSIEAWDEDSVRLVAEKRVDAGNEADAAEAFDNIEIILRESSGLLEIETKLPSAGQGFLDWIFGRGRNAQVRYELRVPRGAQLDIRTVNGNVTTVGAGGHQLLGSTNGRINVGAAGHGVEARTTNGGIDVEIVDSRSQPDVKLGSTNGGISLSLPSSLAGRITARTVNGRVRTELPVSIEGSTSRRRLTGELNGGGSSRIELSTTNGSIQISESD